MQLMMYSDVVMIGRFQRLTAEVTPVMRVRVVPTDQVCVVHSFELFPAICTAAFFAGCTRPCKHLTSTDTVEEDVG